MVFFWCVLSPPLSSSGIFRGRLLTHGAVFLAGFGARGARDRLYRGRQRAEEAGDEGQAQTAPGAEHWPAVTVTDVVWEAVYVTRVTGQLEVDACYTGTQGNDAKCAWKIKEKDNHQIISAASFQKPNELPCCVSQLEFNTFLFWFWENFEFQFCWESANLSVEVYMR